MKSSSNDTVKGFDGVHLLLNQGGFDLLLGESKFYTDPEEAIREAIKSVKEHILPKFLNTEKAMIFGHVAKDIPHRDQILALFKSQTSGDELLKRSVFPIMIAYDSDAAVGHNLVAQPYIDSIQKEVAELRDYFVSKASGLSLRFELIFVPLARKKDVIESFDKLLGAFL